jgi:hypothetical protein
MSGIGENQPLAAVSRSRQSADGVWAMTFIGAHTATHRPSDAKSATVRGDDLLETKTRAHTEFMVGDICTR